MAERKQRAGGSGQYCLLTLLYHRISNKWRPHSKCAVVQQAAKRLSYTAVQGERPLEKYCCTACDSCACVYVREREREGESEENSWRMWAYGYLGRLLAAQASDTLGRTFVGNERRYIPAFFKVE